MKLRSVLFAPGSRPDVMRKLPRAEPDAVVLDLEDAVPAGAKAEARVHVVEVAEALRAEHAALGIFVRVNGVTTEHFAADVAALGADHAAVLSGVMLPKVESAADVAQLEQALDGRGLGRLAVFAGVESVRGVVDVFASLGSPRIVACYFGAEDYVADLGGVRTAESTEVLYARSRVAMAARLAGVTAVDQVVTDLRDEARFVADARAARSLGYRGKLCIHPAQVPWANAAFSSTAAEVDRARRLLGAYEAAAARGEAALAFEGEMVDEPLARQARAVLAAAADNQEERP